MKKLSVLIFLIFAACSAGITQSSYKSYYKDQLAAGEKMISANFYSIHVKTKDRKYVEKIFYPEKKVMTHYITYSDGKFRIKDGPCREWFDNGRLWKEGNFKNDQMDGLWTSYLYDRDVKTDYGFYEAGKKTGKWTILDTLGRIVMEQHFRADQLDGECRTYNDKGEVALIEYYAAGRLIKEQKVPGVSDHYLTPPPPDVRPYFKSCSNPDANAREICMMSIWKETIEKNILYPIKARQEGVMGRAVIKFVVREDGSIGDIVVLRGICTDIEQECLRLLALLPSWVPGMENGIPVRTMFYFPISFRLN